MKSSQRLIIVVSLYAFLLAGCAMAVFYPANDLKLSPKSDASQIILRNRDLATPYNVVGKIQCAGCKTKEQVANLMWEKAAEIGADAVIKVEKYWGGFRGIAVVLRTGLLEEDLGLGLTVKHVEGILGPPYLKSGGIIKEGRAEIHRYVSWKSGKAYVITFIGGRVWKISWFDVSYEIEQAKKRFQASISPGAREDDVRKSLGPPQRVTVEGQWAIWWYEFDKENIYGAFFKDGILLGIKSFKKGEEKVIM